MVLWQCELRESALALRLALLLHGAVILALLVVIWPTSATLVRTLLLASVLLDCVRSLRRIRRRRGDIALLSGLVIRWRQRLWVIRSRPWLTRQAILLLLQDDKGERERLWLFADGMGSSSWRLLRLQLLNNRPQADK